MLSAAEPSGSTDGPDMLEQLHQPDDVDPVVVRLEISPMGAAVAADRESRLGRRPAGDQPPLVEIVDAAPHRAPRVLVDPAERALRLRMVGSLLEHGRDPLLGLGGPAETAEDEPEHAHRIEVVGIRARAAPRGRSPQRRTAAARRARVPPRASASPDGTGSARRAPASGRRRPARTGERSGPVPASRRGSLRSTSRAPSRSRSSPRAGAPCSAW